MSMERESHRWAPVDDLPTDWLDLKNRQTDALIAAWWERADELRETKAYDDFLLRLRRQWAIETGILERLYSLSDGVTKTLIEKGFDAAIISHEDTDRNPTDVIAVIQDQFAVVNGLYQFVSGQRPLGTSYIKELYTALTKHQTTCEGRDTLGRDVRVTLPRGEWKRLPNNVEGPGDYVLEFCPPEQVESEMDRLLAMHGKHEEWGVPVYVEAAWLHHRFTQIHPFADGNGRVARCLATVVLLKAKWFPLVVTRAHREEYISAIRQADKGDMRRLVDLFTSLQSRAVREAFDLTEELRAEQIAVGTILSAVKGKFSRLREETATKKRQVTVTADTLQSAAVMRIKDLAKEVKKAIAPEGQEFSAYCTHAASANDEKADYHQFQIVQCARALGYFANMEAYRSWVNLAIQTTTRSEILFSLHGMGKGLSGIIACSAMFYTKESTDTKHTVIGEIVPLCTEPFTFTYEEEPNEVQERFRKWLDDTLILGLDQWRRGLGA
ncbi:MAG: Fic family protein [Phycisphaerae bacterium]|nr:Fic family protein [Phycisphaerae bacterium]